MTMIEKNEIAIIVPIYKLPLSQDDRICLNQLFKVMIGYDIIAIYPETLDITDVCKEYPLLIKHPMESFHFKPEEMKRGQKCPRCRIYKPDGRDIDAGRFTFHLAESGCGCFHVPDSEKMEVLRSWFRDNDGKP